MASYDDVAGAPPRSDGAGASVPTKVSAPIKFAYSFGQVIETGYYSISTFIFFYYTAVLGLSGVLVGAAMAISMAIDALLDPLIGSISDNVRSKFGRRLPVMMVGAPLTLLATGLMFQPPAALSAILLFAWLTLTKMALRAFVSVYNLPYAALGAEMTDDYVERSSVVAWRTVAGTLASVAITALAYSVFFAGEGGLQRPERYPAFGWSAGALLFAAGLICCLGVWRFAARLPQPTTAPAPLARGLFEGLPEVFRNRSFRTLFFSALMFWAAAGLNGALNNHAYVFVWKLRPEAMQAMTYAYLLGLMAGIPLTPLLLRRIEKKSAVVLGLLLTIGANTLVHLLRASGLFTPEGVEALPVLSVNAAVAGLGVGVLSIAYPSMMADAAEEHEVLFGTRREALYFSGLGFAAKAAAGLGQLVGGLAIDLMRFPKSAGLQVGAEVAEPILRLLVLAWGPLAACLSFIGLLALLPYAIDRRRHEALSARLRVKRAEDVSAGRSS